MDKFAELPDDLWPRSFRTGRAAGLIWVVGMTVTPLWRGEHLLTLAELLLTGLFAAGLGLAAGAAGHDLFPHDATLVSVWLRAGAIIVSSVLCVIVFIWLRPAAAALPSSLFVTAVGIGAWLGRFPLLAALIARQKYSGGSAAETPQEGPPDWHPERLP